MLTRIFATSRPLNYLLVGGYLFAVFVLQLVFDPNTVFDLSLLLKGLLGFGAIFFSILLLDFVVRKNSLSRQNTYIVLVYGCLIAFLPIFDLLFELILAQILMLLGIRRSISLRSNKRVTKKIFDAAFWIAIATLLSFWFAVYLVALYVAILYFTLRSYQYWLLPIFGIAVIAVLYLTGHLMWLDSLPKWTSIFQAPDFDFSSWVSGEALLIPAVYLGLSFICGLIFYVKQRKSLFKLKRIQLYCIFMLLISCTTAIFGPKLQPETWILVTFPLAVVAGNVTQENTHRIITELLLWVLVLCPIALSVMQ